MHIYFIIGTESCGRLEIVYDLIHHYDEDKPIHILMSKTDKEQVFKNAPMLQEKSIIHSFLVEKGIWQIPSDFWQASGVGYWILDPNVSMVDQLEFARLLFRQKIIHVNKIMSVIDCQLMLQKPFFKTWLDACVHFSDVLLITNHYGLTQAQKKDLFASYHLDKSPCLVVEVRHNTVPNPAEVLIPEARRMTWAFDDLDAVDTLDTTDWEIEETLPEHPIMDLTIKEDPYFEKLDNGQRRINIVIPR